MTEHIAWINGEYLPFTEARLSITDSGLVHGDAVTEMLRTFRHQPFRVLEHLARFRHSLRESLLDCPYSDDELTEIVDIVVRRASEDLSKESDIGVILFATSGANVTYVGKGIVPRPTVCVHTFPLYFDMWKTALQQGQHLMVSRHPAIPARSFDPTIKSRSRMHWRIADREIRKTHPHASAVFADDRGNLTETSSGNLFAVLDGEIVTPPSDYVLNGISRQFVIELAEQLGIPVTERLLSIDEVLHAQELWTSSTPYCLLPVTKLNEHVIGAGVPGPVYEQILQAWNKAVKVDVREQIMKAVSS